jgi:uncharacterized protein YjbI with pentapeptide repeats
MHAFFQTLLSTQITLGTALPLLVMAALLVLVAAKAASRPPTPLGTVAKAQPTVLARGDAWLEKIGIGPFWRTAFWVLALAFAFLFIMAIMAAFVLIAGMIKSDTPTTSLGLGALLVALLGAPFLIWRTVVAQNTLDTARKEAKLKEESLFNDKINAAAKDLAARRQVTRVVVQDEKETILTEWEDDLVTRAAAIDRLEGLAIDAIAREDYPPAQHIARMLSTYVRERSEENKPRPLPTPDRQAAIDTWHNDLCNALGRDMERAAQSLGRINPKDETARAAFKSKNIDLRGCNLQGFDLGELNFQGAQFRNAALQVADLQHTDLSWADLTDAGLEMADARGAQFRGALLWGTKLHGINLTVAQATKKHTAKKANLRGSAVSALDEISLAALRAHWEEIIAFQKERSIGAPDHWEIDQNNNLDLNEVIKKWRKWAAELDPPEIMALDAFHPD